LRSLAHPLKPVVQIGHQGLTTGVVAALDVALERHELIKVKIAGDAEVEPEEVAPEIERATHAQLAQLIGHTLVLYRRREREPKIQLPKAKTKAAAARTPAPARDELGDDEADDREELE